MATTYYCTPQTAAFNRADAENGAPGEYTGPLHEGWYVNHNDEGFVGPFCDYPEACAFMEHCEADDRIERRHVRTLYAGSEKV